MAPNIVPIINQEPYAFEQSPFNVKQREDVRKKKFIPWEPFKAAPSADRKGEPPAEAPKELIPYTKSRNQIENGHATPILLTQLIDGKKQRQPSIESDVIKELEQKISHLENDLTLQRNVNAELKRLLLATVNDDLQCHVNALSEDKVQLAHRLNEYATQLQNEDEHIDTLRIEKDVWKCKFMAMSIRADELKGRNEALCAQHQLSDPAAPNDALKNVLSFDLSAFVERSPTEEKYTRPPVKYQNITISCCKNCAGKEIQLL